MQINPNPTSERGASRDAVNRPKETLGDSHLISSDPRSRFGLVCDLLCCRGNKGLTKSYNRFHDPDERSPDIVKLRELHAAMDRAVLDAYGWTDLKPTCEFLLDYEEDEDDEDEPAVGDAARSPGATAGPTTSATKSSPASWNSTASGPRKSD